jgi:hypothetical protein
MMSDQEKAAPQSNLPTVEQPEMSARKRARLEEERRMQELHERLMKYEFSPEDEAILDELGI